MTNLLKETLEKLSENGKSQTDVRWVGTRDMRYASRTLACGSWEDFAGFADFDYDAGYGGHEIDLALVVVGDDWWLERGEYDGSEWWEFKTLPQKSDKAAPMRAEDLFAH